MPVLTWLTIYNHSRSSFKKIWVPPTLLLFNTLITLFAFFFWKGAWLFFFLLSLSLLSLLSVLFCVWDSNGGELARPRVSGVAQASAQRASTTGPQQAAAQNKQNSLQHHLLRLCKGGPPLKRKTKQTKILTFFFFFFFCLFVL